MDGHYSIFQDIVTYRKYVPRCRSIIPGALLVHLYEGWMLLKYPKMPFARRGFHSHRCFGTLGSFTTELNVGVDHNQLLSSSLNGCTPMRCIMQTPLAPGVMYRIFLPRIHRERSNMRNDFYSSYNLWQVVSRGSVVNELTERS